MSYSDGAGYRLVDEAYDRKIGHVLMDVATYDVFGEPGRAYGIALDHILETSNSMTLRQAPMYYQLATVCGLAGVRAGNTVAFAFMNNYVDRISNSAKDKNTVAWQARYYTYKKLADLAMKANAAQPDVIKATCTNIHIASGLRNHGVGVELAPFRAVLEHFFTSKNVDLQQVKRAQDAEPWIPNGYDRDRDEKYRKPFQERHAELSQLAIDAVQEPEVIFPALDRRTARNRRIPNFARGATVLGSMLNLPSELVVKNR